MNVKIKQNKHTVHVTYCKTYNHPINIENTIYQKWIKLGMSSKLALGVPVKQIWKDLLEIFLIEIKEMTNYLYVASEKIKHVGYEKKGQL